jgi:hypothetical protein
MDKNRATLQSIWLHLPELALWMASNTVLIRSEASAVKIERRHCLEFLYGLPPFLLENYGVLAEQLTF